MTDNIWLQWRPSPNQKETNQHDTRFEFYGYAGVRRWTTNTSSPTALHHSHLTALHHSHLTVLHHSHLTVLHHSHLTALHHSHLTVPTPFSPTALHHSHLLPYTILTCLSLHHSSEENPLVINILQSMQSFSTTSEELPLIQGHFLPQLLFSVVREKIQKEDQRHRNGKAYRMSWEPWTVHWD